MSEMFTQYAGTPVRDIHAGPLRDMVKTFVGEADYVMGADLDDIAIAGMLKWLIEFLYNKYGYLPFNHVREAFRAGALGQRGGTTKLIPRNVAIWISEQDKLYQEQRMMDMRKMSEEKRTREMHGGKADHLVATAVRIKVSWLADGRITSEQYDRFSSKEIYELLKSGVSERDIHPKNIVPNYDER
ncbi:hypothetical protein EG830_08250 [bacterium]|nr:hypothetical protein [bacterium]